ncbi:MAG: glycosyltransferase [Candidatus Electryonea clarkiae]|nr:glycosyltransferase [Candidatus Electryonea clarkiae]MDP8287934.1 glycosyltransferase [Candidatus Electryonea clarkiae]
MSQVRSISVVVPAHNEERYLEKCLQAILVAGSRIDVPVETVVVLNRCTDGTESIAAKFHATCLLDQSRCLSKIRNHGVRESSGDIIVTCDADSQIHPEMLRRLVEEIDHGAVGGGVDVRHDRRSAGISVCEAILRILVRLTGVSCGVFWTTRRAFDAINGFDENLVMSEDFNFGRRLRTWGKEFGMPYRTLWDAPVVTSARKFDRFGDWSFLRMIFFDSRRIRRSIKKQDTEFVDEYFYDFNDYQNEG